MRRHFKPLRHSGETKLEILAADLPVCVRPMAHRALCFEDRASIIGGPGQIGNENKRATAIVITSIMSFVVFMISFSPCKVLQLCGMRSSFRGAADVAKVATDPLLQQLDVRELSSASRHLWRVSTFGCTGAVMQITLNRDFLQSV
jgi:hypothetical protein